MVSLDKGGPKPKWFDKSRASLFSRGSRDAWQARAMADARGMCDFDRALEVQKRQMIESRMRFAYV